MNYRKHYNRLIERAKSRKLNCYTETHHIIPKCLDGSNEPSNLVELTPEEHYVAHQLLVKVYPGNYKLIYAAKMMTIQSADHEYRGNKLYGWLRKEFSKAISEDNSGRKRTAESKLKMRLAKLGKPSNFKGHTYNHTDEAKLNISKNHAFKNGRPGHSERMSGEKNPGIIYRGKSWKIDLITNKRIWVERV